ncbi:MAG: TonB-dependent receptor [Desulfurivibrionaceae bacterium]
MGQSIFFVSRTSAGAAFFLLALLPGLSSAAEREASAPMTMYFDDSQMVEVATRAPKPMRQVAENVSIITAEEIGAMHAQSLSEVLGRVAGVNVAVIPPDFNGEGQTFIQGSRNEHVLVLIDGVRLNSAMSGDAVLSHIPLRIIERIEIIKGPASAVWGSSQGGVINIITKKAGTAARPSGSVAGEFGERQVGAYEADLSGKVNRFGYFLYAGKQDSNGLLNDRYYDSGRAYGKLTVDLPAQGLFTLTGSAVDPHSRGGDFDYASPYFSEDIRDRTYFLTANYDTQLTNSLHLNLGARQYERSFIQNLDILSTSPDGDPGALFYQANWHEKSRGANALLTWQNGWQQVALGGEINRNEMGTTTDYGPWTQANWGSPAQDVSRPGYEETWSLFVNDTMRFGRLTLTPGLRYDAHSISGSMLSPSLGATYLLRPDTLLRATASRGFQYPILSYIAGGGIWDNPNPNLKPEKVSSFQVGVENRTLSCLSVKLSAFHHQITDTWRLDDIDWNYKNGGPSQRKGVEAELETTPWQNLSLVANLTYTLLQPEGDQEEDSTTTANLILRFRDKTGWQAELAGQYIWWDAGQVEYQQNAALIWNASLGRTVYSSQWLSCDLYAKVYNIFDGNAYSDPFFPMPDRWLLAGVRVSF